MVIFIIGVGDLYGHGIGVFTFQYGYIYYESKAATQEAPNYIYIPIWLYLL